MTTNNLFGSSTSSLSLSSFPITLKEEGTNSNTKTNLVESLGSLYSHEQTNSSTPMSATALLQKAAQIGSTRSNPSILGTSLGVVTSNVTSNEVKQVYPSNLKKRHDTSGASSRTKAPNIRTIATSMRNIDQSAGLLTERCLLGPAQ